MTLILTAQSISTSSPPPAGDPHWANVLYLFHFDGNDGEKVFIDEKGNPVGNIFNDSTLSTEQFKFGTSSLKCNLDGGIQVTHGGTLENDFTIEGWIYTTSLTSTRCVFDARADSLAQIGIFRNGNYLAWWHLYDGMTGEYCVTNPISINTWYHVAAVRYLSEIKLYVNGVSNGNVYNGLTPHYNKLTHGIGNDGTGGYTWAGYIDEFRTTSNVARYTSNFTPPTAPFPNG